MVISEEGVPFVVSMQEYNENHARYRDRDRVPAPWPVFRTLEEEEKVSSSTVALRGEDLRRFSAWLRGKHPRVPDVPDEGFTYLVTLAMYDESRGFR